MKKKLRLSRETLSALSLRQVGGGTNESCERACASAESDCRWTCGAYSECYPTHCYCNSGVYTDCTCPC